MESKTGIVFSVLLLSMSVHADEYKTLVSVKGIQSKIDDFFVDDTLKVAIVENSKELNDIHYSYSKIGPTPACGNADSCSPTSASVITFDIDGGALDKTINVSYMCDSIGIYKSFHNGMRDLHCGPSYKLVWTGSEYDLVK
ncbi:TPA: hypothetical protein OMU28_002150 [Klebsiella aerogenes]|nr:hypothetical protein [Klebsiella aerogenes]